MDEGTRIGATSYSAARWYTLFLLTLCYTLSFVDSKIPFILVEPIKHDLGLSDTQIGLITGPSFSIIYALAAFPISRVSDRGSRTRIIAIAVAVWSLFTSMGGWARTAVQLMVSRSGVAIGEAALTPAAHSLLADSFPPHERGRAISIYMTGIMVGTSLAMAVGGVASERVGWRHVLTGIGAIGLIVAILVAVTIREPARRPDAAPAEGQPSPDGFAQLLRDPTVRNSVLGATLLCLSLGSAVSWTAAYVVRHFGLSIGLVGVTLGLVSGVFGLAGTLAGGWLNDAGRRRSPGLCYRILSACFALYTVLRIAGYFTDNYAIFLALCAATTALAALYTGPTYASVQARVAPQSRSRASAILIVASNGLGIAGGAFFTGWLSDAFGSLGNDSLRAASILMSLASFAACWFYWAAGRHMDRAAS